MLHIRNIAETATDAETIPRHIPMSLRKTGPSNRLTRLFGNMANSAVTRSVVADSVSMFLDTHNPRKGRAAVMALCAVVMLSVTAFLIHSSARPMELKVDLFGSFSF